MTDMAKAVLAVLRKNRRVEGAVLEWEGDEKIRVGLKIGGVWNTVRAPWGMSDVECANALLIAFDARYPKKCAGCASVIATPAEVGAIAFEKDFCWMCMESGEFYKHGPGPKL